MAHRLLGNAPSFDAGAKRGNRERVAILFFGVRREREREKELLPSQLEASEWMLVNEKNRFYIKKLICCTQRTQKIGLEQVLKRIKEV